MADDWEQIVDATIKKTNLNKWQGEDEEDEVKESWEEEEEEEKKDEEKVEIKMVKKPKKSLQEKIAEKEKILQDELERKQRELEEEEDALSPEEKLAEKLRIQKLQEESDLKTALETFGIVDKSSGIDSINPTNKAEFTEFAEAISKKVAQFKTKEDFPNFIEELVRSLCANLSSIDIRKVKTTLDTLCLEKQKLEKEKTKKGKSKAKAKLRLEGDNAIKANMEGYADYDYDDFM